MFRRLSCVRSSRGMSVTARPLAACAIIATAVAGCSADVTRFDGAFGLTETPAATHATSRRNPSRPIVTEAPLSNSGGSYDATPPAYGSQGGGITVSALPDTGGGNAAPSHAPEPSYTPPPPPPASAARVVVPSTPATRSASAGRTIEVQPGDTISGLARRHNVSISDLMSANNLRSPAIKPGQQLVLPDGATRRALPVTREAAAPARTPVRPAGVSSAEPPPTPGRRDWSGSYTIKPGESLYGIARKFGVKSEELQAANAVTDVRKVRPGTVLKVPGSAGAPAPALATANVPEHPQRASVREEAPAPAAAEPVARSESALPRVINGGGSTQVAAASEPRESISDAAPLAPPAESAVATPASPKAGGPNRLRWPVRGKVIAGFGRLTDGTHNDGVNIQVPAGTDVLAAEAGTVAYSGNEVKGYGNLVLVRHDNGWVTAYAHNDTLLVQRGDRVRRGQPLAKVGKTGSVEQPQLHFELRQGSKPVDPLPFMERL